MLFLFFDMRLRVALSYKYSIKPLIAPPCVSLPCPHRTCAPLSLLSVEIYGTVWGSLMAGDITNVIGIASDYFPVPSPGR